MNKKIFTISLSILISALALFVICISPAQAASLASRLSGRILLQVQEHGEAWYVDPITKLRAFLGRPRDAFSIMRKAALGISEEDYYSFDDYAPSRLSGRILLRPESHGEAYYVNPVDLKMHYLGRPLDAFEIMRELGLGITNADLEKIPITQGEVSVEERPGVEEEPKEKEKIPCENECDKTGLRRCADAQNLQICRSNHDADPCLEWGPPGLCDVLSKCENGYCVKNKCLDGTLFNQCSATKPKYCDNGELVDNCNLCDCPRNERLQNNERCLENGSCTIFSENVDCENKHYKMAFILLAQSADEITVEAREETAENRFERLSTIKNEFPQYFAKATRNLASMDTSNDIYIIAEEDLPMRYHEERHLPDYEKVIKKFYETHDDIYDFISVFSTFSIPEYISHTSPVRNINGIGQLVPLYNSSSAYGSRGKLKGINKMGFIDQIALDDDGREIGGANGLLHETGHQWCCFAGDNFAQGQDGAELEIIQQGIHFYYGLQSPCDTGTPMGAHYWVPNDDGTFRSASKGRIEECYHPFQLYFMGLLPKEEYSTKHQVYNAGAYGAEDPKRAVPYKQISVNDIIEVEGERECVLE